MSVLYEKVFSGSSTFEEVCRHDSKLAKASGKRTTDFWGVQYPNDMRKTSKIKAYIQGEMELHGFVSRSGSQQFRCDQGVKVDNIGKSGYQNKQPYVAAPTKPHIRLDTLSNDGRVLSIEYFR